MELDAWIERIRDQDAMTYEEACWGERPSGPDVVPRLIAELQRSPDSYTRGKFAELLGEMGDASVVPTLVAELDHPVASVSDSAMLALEELGLPEGVAAATRYRQRQDEGTQPEAAPEPAA